MSYAESWILVSRLAFAAVATFFAILLWSRTRDVAWMLIVFGVVSSYVGMIIELFTALGVLDSEWGSFGGVPVARIASENAPYAFFIAAFVVALARRRHKERWRR